MFYPALDWLGQPDAKIERLPLDQIYGHPSRKMGPVDSFARVACMVPPEPVQAMPRIWLVLELFTGYGANRPGPSCAAQTDVSFEPEPHQMRSRRPSE